MHQKLKSNKCVKERKKEGMKEGHFIYSYVPSDIWLRTTQLTREEGLNHWSILCLHYTTTNSSYGRKYFIKRTQHILFMVKWLRAYGKGPLRQCERKPIAYSD